MGGFGTGGEEIGFLDRKKSIEDREKKIDLGTKSQESRKKRKLEVIPVKLWICWDI